MSAIRRAILVAGSERYLILGLTLAQTAATSRLLTPAEIGVSVVGVALLQVVDAVRDMGTTAYLIQQPRITKRTARTAFTILFLISSVLGGAVFASAPLWADLYREPHLTMFLRVLAFGFLLAPFSAISTALMRRDLHFAHLCCVNVVTTATYAICLLILAVAGFGYMSFAWATLAAGLATALISLSLRPVTWAFVPCLAEWRASLAWGSVLSFTNVMNRAYEMLPLIALGWFLPAGAVGLYSRALVASQLPDRVLLNAISSVTLPAFAAEARDGRPLKSSYLAALGYLTVVQWPALLLLALLADPVVAIMLGPQWGSSAGLLSLLALASALAFPASLTYPVLLASGGLRDTLVASLISLPVSAVVIVSAAQHGPWAVAASQFVTQPLQVAVALHFVRRRVPFSLGEMWDAVRPSAAVSLATLVPAALVAALSPAPLGIVPGIAAGLVGGCSWAIAVLLLRHPIAEHILTVTRPLVRFRFRRPDLGNEA